MAIGRKRVVVAAVLAAGLIVQVGCGDTEPTVATQPESLAAGTAAAVSETAETVDPTHVVIDNAMAGWIATGLGVNAGDGLALFGSGTWEAQGITFEPRHVLWYRIGENGPAVNFAANQEIFSATDTGELFITLRPLGVYWPDERGTYPAGFTELPALPVALNVEAVRLSGDAGDALQAMADNGHQQAGLALTTLAGRRVLPEGFAYLSYLGRSNVWADGTAKGGPGIHAQTDDDVGIVKKVLDLPLTPETTVSFDWLYESLPALGPETEAQFHDYLSIAIEFDNGQDLTWMWSKELDAESHFGCPLEWWDSRETHYVLQSGPEGLGEWHSHARNIVADYEASIDLPVPERIVGVWFIANSLFGRQRGAASFANVVISSDGVETSVFDSDPTVQAGSTTD
jgi:hypothetical protein